MIVTLTLSLHSYAIGLAYHFTRINISPKFDEDFSNSSGELDRTRTCYGLMDDVVLLTLSERQCFFLCLSNL